MSELRTMIEDSVERLFANLMNRKALEAADQGGSAAEVWLACSEAGLERALASERHGGIGAGLADVYPILRAAGYHALSVPLADTLMAGWLLSRADIEPPPGRIALMASTEPLPVVRAGSAGATRISGTANGICWGGAAEWAIAAFPAGTATHLCLVKLDQPGIRRTVRPNRANEPAADLEFRDAAVFCEAVLDGDGASAGVLSAGALARSAQMTGSLERVLELSIQYAGERVQFGKPIGKNQAIQQMLATLAGQVASARSASVVAFSGETANGFDLAVAKVRASEAAGIGAAIAHQVHGAIGFTHEHILHFFTRRLWSWRGEFGGDAFWAQRLGRAVMAVGSEQFWPAIVARSLRPMADPLAPRSAPTH